MAKKTNPRKIPRTQADVDKAFELGKEAGTELCLTLVLFTLQDRFGANDSQISEFSEAFHYTLDSLQKGYITESDLKKVLKDEYDTSVEVL